jgi:hypothetical protein
MVDVVVTIPELPNVEIDDEAISRWISSRLNAARNVFIRRVSRGGGSGRVYRRGKRHHVASAPGEYPVTDSGRLVSSVDWELLEARSGRLLSDIDYAAYLTSGTSTMAPRKMLADALDEALNYATDPDGLAQALKVG